MFLEKVLKAISREKNEIRSVDFYLYDYTFSRLIAHSKESNFLYYQFIRSWGIHSIPKAEQWFANHFENCLDLIKLYPDDSFSPLSILQQSSDFLDVNPEFIRAFMTKLTPKLVNFVISLFARKCENLNSKMWKFQIESFGTMINLGDFELPQRIILDHHANFFKTDQNMRISSVLSLATLFFTEDVAYSQNVYQIVVKLIPSFVSPILDEHEDISVRQACILCIFYLVSHFPEIIDDDVDGVIIGTIKILFENNVQLFLFSLPLLNALYTIKYQEVDDDDSEEEEIVEKMNPNLEKNLMYFCSNLCGNLFKFTMTKDHFTDYLEVTGLLIREMGVQNESHTTPSDFEEHLERLVEDIYSKYHKTGFPKDEFGKWAVFLSDIFSTYISKRQDDLVDMIIKDFDLNQSIGVWNALCELVEDSNDFEPHASKFFQMILDAMSSFHVYSYEMCGKVLENENVFGQGIRLHYDCFSKTFFQILDNEEADASGFRPVIMSQMINLLRVCPADFRIHLEIIMKKISMYMTLIMESREEDQNSLHSQSNLLFGLCSLLSELIDSLPKEMKQLEGKKGGSYVQKSFSMILVGWNKSWLITSDAIIASLELINDLYELFGVNDLNKMLAEDQRAALRGFIYQLKHMNEDHAEMSHVIAVTSEYIK